VLILRTLFGFGMGAEWTAGSTLAMENWPRRSRGIASGILQGSWAIGYLLAAAVASFVVPRFGWRALFLIAAAPALLVLPIRAWAPESPDWKRREFDANASQNDATASRNDAVASKALAGRVLWASLVMACGFGAYYALTALYPTLLDELGLGQRPLASLVALFNVGMLLGALVCGALAARLGVTRAVAIPALLALPFLPLYVGARPALLAHGAFLGGLFGVGFAGIVPLFLTNLFPAEVRARAVGIAYHLGAFFAAFVPTGIAALADRGVPLARAILGCAGACEIALVIALILPKLRPALAGAPAAAAPAPSDTTS
jgi:MFS transporter, SHS family, lactate transporter